MFRPTPKTCRNKTRFKAFQVSKLELELTVPTPFKNCPNHHKKLNANAKNRKTILCEKRQKIVKSYSIYITHSSCLLGSLHESLQRLLCSYSVPRLSWGFKNHEKTQWALRCSVSEKVMQCEQERKLICFMAFYSALKDNACLFSIPKRVSICNHVN